MITNPLPILYSFRRCPYAIRARMALTMAQCSVELREVVLKNKPASMLAHSPKGTVPILILPDGLIVDESLEIIDWAIAKNSCAISAPNPAQIALIKHNDSEFKATLDRYKYFDRFPEHDQRYYRHRGQEFLELLEQMLAQQHQRLDDLAMSGNVPSPINAFLYGDSAGYADIAIFPFIRQFSHVDKTWFEQANYPRLQHWLNFFLTSENFLLVMRKFSAWQQGDTITVFPTCD